MIDNAFHNVIDKVETLSDDQQELLVDIIKKRLIEKRREEIAENILKVKNEYKSGNYSTGDVDDLIKALKNL